MPDPVIGCQSEVLREEAAVPIPANPRALTLGPSLFDVCVPACKLADMLKEAGATCGGVRFRWKGHEHAIEAGKDPEEAAWAIIRDLVLQETGVSLPVSEEEPG